MASTVEATHIKGLIHNNIRWNVVRIENSYYARCGTSDTGPYSTQQQAEEFIREIKS